VSRINRFLERLKDGAPILRPVELAFEGEIVGTGDDPEGVEEAGGRPARRRPASGRSGRASAETSTPS
jgi:hypothetical protein